MFIVLHQNTRTNSTNVNLILIKPDKAEHTLCKVLPELKFHEKHVMMKQSILLHYSEPCRPFDKWLH